MLSRQIDHVVEDIAKPLNILLKIKKDELVSNNVYVEDLIQITKTRDNKIEAMKKDLKIIMKM